ncbi:MAG: hypothetical protein JSU75_03200 [Gammaproteobacteria bacterium]|nr:MAG: hypothetical protein JSU75_03200 [Gammaproteobacteria bacterium]
MTQSTTDAGMISVLLDRLEKHRLPRILALKDKVDGGEPLGDFDIEFLEQVFADAGKVNALVDRHPEYRDLASKVLGLYNEITSKALENERHSD